MKIASYALLLILASAIFPLSLKASDLEEEMSREINELETRRTAVFVSKCGSENDLSATLFFDVQKRKWFLYEESHGYADNWAGVHLGPDGPTLEETNGGVYTMARVSKLIKELTGYGFDLLAPFTVEKLEKLRPRAEKCLNVCNPPVK